jgi:hypothetical protein
VDSLARDDKQCEPTDVPTRTIRPFGHRRCIPQQKMPAADTPLYAMSGSAQHEPGYMHLESPARADLRNSPDRIVADHAR